MKLRSQSGAKDKNTRGAEKKIAKPKKDEKVPRKAVGRSSEKEKELEFANLSRDKRAKRRAIQKRIDKLEEKLKKYERRMQRIAAVLAARALAAMPAPAA